MKVNVYFISTLEISASKDHRAKDIDNVEVNGITLRKFKSLIGVRPQVIEDFEAIFEKFPHDNLVTQWLFSFVSELTGS